MLLVDPHVVSFDAASLWDVLEHIPDFQSLLANVREWVFLSLPIFRDAEHALRFQAFQAGGALLVFHPRRTGVRDADLRIRTGAESTMETDLGREDIGTFAFRGKRDDRL